MSQALKFYLNTIPGLESASHLELCEKWGRAADFLNLPAYPDVEMFKGGLEFQAPQSLGFALNPFLKCNTRILLRLNSYEAKNEKEFVAGLAKIKWSDYFPQKSYFDFKFSSKSSKISMNRQVQECLQKALKKHGVKYKKQGQTIYVRMFRDQCNISLDLAGEASFKRGENKMGSIASLRASTAHALLRLLFQGIKDPFVLIDPMSGAGTFLSEALNYNSPMKREFALENFPIFSEQKEQVAKTQAALKGEPMDRLKQLYGFDNNDKALAIASKNLTGFDEKLVLEKADLFDPKQGLVSVKDFKKVVVVNPPWGKRLPGSSKDILKTVYDKYQPDRIGLLMPARWKINSIALEKVRDIPILNSGVENRFLIFA